MSDDLGTMPGEAEGRRCEEKDCPSFNAMPCYLSIDDEDKGEVNGWYCPTHAFGQGFCSICGQFWGGIESFDFGPGYCEHCASEVEEPDFDEDDCELPEYEP